MAAGVEFCEDGAVNSLIDSSPVLGPNHPLVTGQTTDASLVRAARGNRTERTPVWFMRQAGRSLPEYRAVREGTEMLEACFNAELVTEITLQPVRRHGVDAAIFFSDIVVPIKAVGVDVEIQPGVGPVVLEPFRSRADLDRLRDLESDDIRPIIEAISTITAELGSTPLIGFAGAPFTVASYLIEGRPSRDYLYTKALMLQDPETWNLLLAKIARISGEFLRQQVLAGASVVQLFDSWVGALSRAAYVENVQTHSATTLGMVADLSVPKIHFGVNTGELIGDMHRAGADVMGVDFRLPLEEASRRLGGNVPLQGNLDPATLFVDAEVRESAIDSVLDSAADLPGHIFNLGHGVPPNADPGVITSVVDYVHQGRTS